MAVMGLLIQPLPKSTYAQKLITPLTVCEILKDLKSYNGKTVAVIGRLVSTEEGRWLGQDACSAQLKTGDFVWSNFVWLEYDALASSALEKGMALNLEVTSEKLNAIKRTTKIRGEYDSWAVVYGRLETHEPLETVLARDGKTVYGVGFGHLGGAPAQVVYREKDIKILSDTGRPKE